jgi:hypothetical protein
MPLPHLALIKLRSGRITDMADLSRMLGLADDEVRRQVRELVARHGEPGDSEDIEQVILLGELEAGSD